MVGKIDKEGEEGKEEWRDDKSFEKAVFKK